MNSANMNNAKERPEYGYYVGYSVIITFLAIGLIGLALLILGFRFGYFLNIVFWVIGATLILLFLWPGIGMLFTNRNANKKKTLHFDFLR